MNTGINCITHINQMYWKESGKNTFSNYLIQFWADSACNKMRHNTKLIVNILVSTFGYICNRYWFGTLTTCYKALMRSRFLFIQHIKSKYHFNLMPFPFIIKSKHFDMLCLPRTILRWNKKNHLKLYRYLVKIRFQIVKSIYLNGNSISMSILNFGRTHYYTITSNSGHV